MKKLLVSTDDLIIELDYTLSKNKPFMDAILLNGSPVGKYMQSSKLICSTATEMVKSIMGDVDEMSMDTILDAVIASNARPIDKIVMVWQIGRNLGRQLFEEKDTAELVVFCMDTVAKDLRVVLLNIFNSRATCSCKNSDCAQLKKFYCALSDVVAQSTVKRMLFNEFISNNNV